MIKSERINSITLALAMTVMCGHGLVLQPASAQDRYVTVPEGTLDTDTGLIWGYHATLASYYLQDLGIHDEITPPVIWELASAGFLNCNDDGTGFCTYEEFSNWFAFGDDVESHNFDWRLATIDELVDAHNDGLFEFHDANPAEGFQPLTDFRVWSLTETKYRGVDSAYAFSPVLGPFITTKESGISAIYVRGVEPPADDGPGGGGGGNGGGKGKNK